MTCDTITKEVIMKNKLMILAIMLLIVLNIFISSYAFDLNRKYTDLKVKYDVVNKNRLDIITLKLKESTCIELGDKEYSIKLLEIIKDPPCITTSIDTSTDCVRNGEYDIKFSIDGIIFALDSGLNYSAQIITTDFITNYVIYYVSEYNDLEATFFIEEDRNYKK